jgi:hypothetical protein
MRPPTYDTRYLLIYISDAVKMVYYWDGDRSSWVQVTNPDESVSLAVTIIAGSNTIRGRESDDVPLIRGSVVEEFYKNEGGDATELLKAYDEFTRDARRRGGEEEEILVANDFLYHLLRCYHPTDTGRSSIRR